MSYPFGCLGAACRRLAGPPCPGGQVGGGVSLTRYAIGSYWFLAMCRLSSPESQRKFRPNERKSIDPKQGFNRQCSMRWDVTLFTPRRYGLMGNTQSTRESNYSACARNSNFKGFSGFFEGLALTLRKCMRRKYAVRRQQMVGHRTTPLFAQFGPRRFATDAGVGRLAGQMPFLTMSY